MSLSLGVIFGILSMLCWGSADFVTKKLTERIGVYHSILYRSFFSGITLLIAALMFTGTIFTSLKTTLIFLAIGILGYFSYVFYVKAIEKGNVSVISPIAHSSVIITVLLSVFFFKESLSLLQIVAMAVIIIGIVLVSFRYSELKASRKGSIVKGLGFALLTFLGWGILFFVWKIPLTYTNAFIVAFYLESLVFVYTLISALFLKKKILLPNVGGKTWFFAVYVGVILALGSLFYTIGINTEFVSLIIPIAAASPLVSVILARIFLKEKLELNQMIAVVMILIGLIAISL